MYILDDQLPRCCRPLPLLVSAVLLFIQLVAFPSVSVALDRTIPDLNQRYNVLLNKAQRLGQVRVIATLQNPDPFILSPSAVPNDAARRGVVAQVQDDLLEKLKGYNAVVTARLANVPAIGLKVDAPALRALASWPEVVSIANDEPMPALLTYSVPLTGADVVQNAGYDGSGIAVAIIDTGIDSNSAALAGRVVAEACYSTDDASQNATTLCPNGQISQTGAGAANACPSSIAGCSHGTQVADIAAGPTGVASNANIIAIQAYSRLEDSLLCPLPGARCPCLDANQPSPCALSFPINELSALDEVYRLRSAYTIAAANLSLGSGTFAAPCDNVNPTYTGTINLLRSANIATVVASGNGGDANALTFPACISSAISVGATDEFDSVWNKSDSSTFLSLLAPGVDITAVVPGGGVRTESGTSFAAPHVAGAWALLRQLAPSVDVGNALAVLQQTGKAITDSRNNVTISRIQLDTAIQHLARFDIGNNVVASAGLPVSTPDPCSLPYEADARANGDIGVVIDGPRYCDGHTRWKIRWCKDNLEGWSPEEDSGAGYLLAPSVSGCIPSSRTPTRTPTPTPTPTVITNHTVTITSGPSGSPNPVESGGVVNLSAAASDSSGFNLTYLWTASCPALGSNGTFSNKNVPNPTWSAPTNTGVQRSCTIMLTATAGDASDSKSYTQRVNGSGTTTVELLTNPSFTEGNGSNGWTVSGSFHADKDFPNCHGPSCGNCFGYAYCSGAGGAPGNDLLGTLEQTVTIPANATSALFSFWYSITTQDTSSLPQDNLSVSVRDSKGHSTPEALLSQLVAVSDACSYRSSGYYDLSAFAGQTVTLSFLCATGPTGPTTFRIDDVSLSAQLKPECASAAECDDGNPCTNDSCSNGACSNTPNTASCDDGIFCDGTDTCNGGNCQHSGNPCVSGSECNNLCNETSHSCHVPAGAGCSDDGNGCTSDQCDGSGNCTHPPNSAPCDDGIFCNGTDTCSGGSCRHSGSPCSQPDEVCNEAGQQCLIFTATPTNTLTPSATDTATPTRGSDATDTPTTAPRPTATPGPCYGDCNDDSAVTIDELIDGINIALGTATLDECQAFDCNGRGGVTVDCLVRAVNSALSGCVAPGNESTRTPTPTVGPPTVTTTVVPTTTVASTATQTPTPSWSVSATVSPSATLTPSPEILEGTVNYLIVGGGGYGGSTHNDSVYGAGGGGGGGVLAGTTIFASQAYSVTVGNGGQESSALGYTAYAGGAGGDTTENGHSGASGGGGGAVRFANPPYTATTGGTATQGHSGGGSAGRYYGAGGGGGAASAGGNGSRPPSGTPGNGGNGVANSISGVVVYYGGGGGAGGQGSLGIGGLGGGGNGGSYGPGVAGSANTGGGGGGSGWGNDAGAAGGSGVVILSAAIGVVQNPTLCGGTHTTAAGNDIWTFTSSGTWAPILGPLVTPTPN